MKEILKDIKYQVKEIEEKENSVKYLVKIGIPMKIGWINCTKFFIESSSGREAYILEHTHNKNDYAYFEKEIELPVKALYHYYFTIEANNQFMYYKKENLSSYTSITPDEMFKMSVGFKVPDWTKGKIMYHIFLDRFYRGNTEPLKTMKDRTIHSSWDEEPIIGPDENNSWNTDFYGGDLKGIEKKLEYIKSLGVTIIYISPVVHSQSNHRYDTADYEQIDPYAGSLDDLKSLCNKAHSLGMKIILDAVFNHTGNDSKYFNQYGNFDTLGAYQSDNSPYANFYRSYIHNNERTFDYWWGMKNLPVCDGNSKAWQNYIYGEGGIIDLWFSKGIDGLRLDVADELTDDFIEGIRKAVKRNKEDGFILGEVWKNPMRMNRSYIESGKAMDSVMNYPLADALIRYFKYEDKEKIKEVLRELRTEYPDETLYSLMNFTSTHDISRALDIFGTKEFQYTGEWAWDLNNRDINYQKNFRLSNEEYQRGKEIYKSYLFTLIFLPGILSIFYGDEAGIQGLGNLANRKPFPWHNIDMDLLAYIKWLGSIRQKEQFLEQADFKVNDITNQLLMFERIDDYNDALIMMNRSSNKLNIHLPHEFRDEEIIYSLGNTNKEEIAPHGGLVLKKVRK